MLTSLMTELAGDDGRAGGALLRQARSTNSAKMKPHVVDQGSKMRISTRSGHRGRTEPAQRSNPRFCQKDWNFSMATAAA
jgi:hypothetical protein